jgi:NADP-dependent 3-hydroxy acid dehydrogenase YdfG
MQRSIAGEVAWVTGGGTGIGQAGAVRLAGAGAKIVLTGRRRAPLDETAKMIRDKGRRGDRRARRHGQAR